ncbi:hypothetical protein KDY119_02758 [Luteimicrobium xylanilyticum]|uniref:AB hydrolase-1 domain-containing protein n=1 Tax=Luteimicrobium xylanilyticum TaxID=1133546 RepID=A0A5P9QCQ8_9MICO|nr:alpha/beta hydrolase [Luteimicrobium xylanilyticum]QFU99231.1 hypothetical protein KDY119_02758 [Luteimicrobium xylanilyticum]
MAENTALTTPNRSIDVGGDTFAYRRLGSPGTTPPLVMLQHFRGNLDFWDPDLLDALAADREVITVDLRGVGGSSGATRTSVWEDALDVVAFVDALGLETVDLFGFSLGGHVAQDVVLARPRLVRRLVLGGTAPMGAPGLHRWNDDVYAYATGDETSADDFVALFFSGSASSTALAWEHLRRRSARTEADVPTSLAARDAQLVALTAWGIPDRSRLERLSAITQPTLVLCGDDDTMMVTANSVRLADAIPGAQLRVYPDAGHGFLDQLPVLVAEHVRLFLGR